MKVFEELQLRGFIAQCTHEEEIRKLLNEEKITFYIGIDATADSLTAGHYSTLMAMKHLQNAGHRPIILIGGGTTLIGDPSHRNEMRRIMTLEEIDSNAEKIKDQASVLIDFSHDRAIMRNNAHWLRELNFLDFLREFGPHFSINRMVQMESYKTRMEDGLTLLEFNYMPMQAYDFFRLFRDENCIMQMGGTDQWSNIIGGIDLIRKIDGKQAYGMTFELLTTSTGEKMGKTASGAVWLDPEKTSCYDFYQYWRNVEDSSVKAYLKRLTLVPLEEIEELTKEEGAALNKAKEVLAYEICSIVHGKEEATKAMEASRALFSQKKDSQDLPSITIKNAQLGKEWLDILVEEKIFESKSEGRRLVQQGGLRLNEEKVQDPSFLATREDFSQGHALFRKGKKNYYKLVLSED